MDIRACKSLFVLAAALASRVAGAQIQSDETVILFPAFAVPASAEGGWEVDLHGWVYEAEKSSASRRAALALAWAIVGDGSTDAREREIFDARMGLFFADNERGKSIEVKVCGKTRALEDTAPNGHCRGRISLSLSEVEREPRSAPGSTPRIQCEVVLSPGDSRRFRGEIHLLAEEGLSVISDIDDTVKESNVLNKAELIRNTLLRPSRAVEGMAELYAPLASAGASFHYVTGSPWQLYAPLQDFLRAARLPGGSFHMRDLRIKDPGTIADMFAAPVDHKRAQIEPLVRALPRRKFVLVGDSGEKDPEVYGEVARRFPQQVRAIWIRDIQGDGPESERMKTAFEGVAPGVWRVFKVPGEMLELARELARTSRQI